MPEADLRLLLDAAHEAGKIASSYFRKNPKTRDKGDGQGPVTEADLAVNDMLLRDLRAARPDYGWLSEETEDGTDRLSANRVFIIDPIDGTRAFIEGNTAFSHSLAIVEGGKTVAAVVHLPQQDRTYAAALGRGATLNDDPIHVSDRSGGAGAQILTKKSNMDPQHWPGGVPDITRHFRSSIAYRLSLVGHGRFDGMLTLQDAWEWDVAAGVLIVREAGGTVTDRHGQPLAFNNAHPKVPGVLAAPPPVHRDLLAHLA